MRNLVGFFFSSAFFLILSVVFVVLSTFLTTDAYGANGNSLWNANGEFVGAGRFYATASDGAGGVFVAWDEEPGIRVQHLDGGGTPQWTAPGKLLSAAGTSPAITVHNPTGATVAWEEAGGINVQRVDYSGTALWTAGGVQVSTNGEVPVLVHVPGASIFDPPSTLIAWGQAARVAHVDSSGNVTAPGVDGIALGSSVRLPGYMRMVTDGAGGAIVVWADFAKNIVAQRVNAGLPWGTTPTVVSNDARDEGPLSATPDGSGGAIISWTATRPLPANGQIRAQRINSSGISQWVANGVVVVDSDVVGGNTTAWTQFEFDSTVASDTAGGAIVAWNDWRNDPTLGGDDDVYAQRLDASAGSAAWAANGILLPPYIVGATAPGSQRGPRAAADGNGGAVVTYQDSGGISWDISATRVDAYGNKLFSISVFSDYNQGDAVQKWPEIAFDGSGTAPVGAIVAWVDQSGGQDVMAQKIEISGPPNDAAGAPETVTILSQKQGTTLAATPDGSSSCGSSGETDVWYYFVPPAWPGTLEVDTCGTNDTGGVDTGMDSVLSIHSAAPGTAANELACNDDWNSGGTPASQCSGTDSGVGLDSSTTVVLAGSASPVWIRVSHFPNSSPGDFTLHVRYVPEPGKLLMLASGLLGLGVIARRRRAEVSQTSENEGADTGRLSDDESTSQNARVTGVRPLRPSPRA